jgi:MFS family permease
MPLDPDDGPAPGARALLRDARFRRFWLARVAASAASQMLMVALGWQMYDLTGSAWDLGLVGLAQFVPALALALPAGHVVDRHARQRVLALALAVQTVLALALALAAWQHAVSRALVLGVSVALGALRAFQMPASQALLPQLVPLVQLPRALALASAGLQGAIITGPALGGAVYALGPTAVYALAALGFAAAVAWLWGVRTRGETAASGAREPLTWRSMSAGLAYIWHHPVMLGAISLDLFAVLLGGATALLPMFARDILHTGPWGLGLLRAAPAAGALLMSLALARWPLQRRVGRWLLLGVAAYGVATGVFALSTWFWLSWAALAASGAADMVSVVVRQSLAQLETPDQMRGRVAAVNSLFIGASNQLGEFESGATAALLGPVGSVLLGSAGTLLVVALWWRLFPALARRDGLLAAPTPAAGAAPRG